MNEGVREGVAAAGVAGLFAGGGASRAVMGQGAAVVRWAGALPRRARLDGCFGRARARRVKRRRAGPHAPRAGCRSVRASRRPGAHW